MFSIHRSPGVRCGDVVIARVVVKVVVAVTPT
jgi:hypothetical protein